MTEMNITTSIDLPTSAHDAWTLIGEGFGEWAEWAPGIDRSTLAGPLAEGVLRVNEAPSLGTVTQKLVRYEPYARALAYEMIEGLPPFFASVRNDWRIEESGPESSRLVGEARFVLREEAEAMRAKLEGKMGMTLEVFAKAAREALETQRDANRPAAASR